jgi:predicted NUDIX family NTP pyrophosphohydrolase
MDGSRSPAGMAKSSAGLLLFRQAGVDRVEVLLVHPGGPFWTNRDDHAWSIPKGEYQADEDPREAAEREFAEELGRVAPGGTRVDLGEIRQAGGKRVRAWAVQAQDFATGLAVSNEFEMEWPPKSGEVRSFPEIDRVEWVDIADARRLLVPGQVELVDRLIERVAGGSRRSL